MRATRHAIDRAAERYGVTATEDDFAVLVCDLLDTLTGVRASAVRLRRLPSGLEHWLARLCGVAVIVVYAPDLARVLTVLPESALRRRR